MSNQINLIVLLLLFCLGCKTQGIQKDDSQTDKISIQQSNPDNDRWVYYYNLKSDSLKLIYDINAVKILSNGEVIEGSEQITSYLLSDSKTIVTTHSDTIIIANEKRAIDYEILESTYENNEKLKSLVIWQTQNQERKRVFEFTAKVEPTTKPTEEISERRNLWMSLCNAHDAKELVQELYSQNTLYFNHKPIIKGRELVTAEYQYMNRESYQLALQAISIEAISDDFVFEIGQCAGSYNGKYILIWRKDTDGKWRIFIDSNI